ncbi:substrate-binding domain-containing protein [Curvibacter sp. CHRR-16]|uniref:substrate-binding domain-containing protein n=1 Tax=Curvibacter sp. CHRR-16 TaxID=2835872 RepID=UPI001BDA6E06|nr:substrate-binding domain-containing protein [Curvibacter sp. CHRR-16]MBT0568844.1 substrate-binding domain-containing protein [Curvibacter sp. CHRR-16]
MHTPCANTLTGISSMATRAVLADLVQAYVQQGGSPIAIESVGGVDAAKRVQAGESFDAVFLAGDAIDKLIASSHVLPDSRVDLMRSAVSVAVPAGAALPDISSEAALRATVLAAPTIGYSTGPSGVALVRLFERWGLAAELHSRIVQAPAGVPVGTLVAQGKVALGFQQTSELLFVPGITLVGPMPDEVAILTTFSAGICTTCRDVPATHALLEFFASPAALAAKRRQGMEAV